MRDSAVEAALAEYEALTREVAGRSAAQHVVLNLSVVATGAITSVALAGSDRKLAFLVLPLICTVLSAVWLDHARCIVNIGTYIRTARWPQLCDLVGHEGLLTYEKWAHEDRSSLLRASLAAGPSMAAFMLPSIAGLWLALHAVRGPLLWSLWVLALALSLMSVGYWLVYLRGSRTWTYVGPSFSSAG